MSDLKLRRARMLFLLGVAALLFASCGGDKNSDDNSFYAVPEWMNEHKDDIVFWARGPLARQTFSDRYIFYENGSNFMFVKGNCEFWVYLGDNIGFGDDPYGPERWSDIYTGILPEAECIQFQKDMRLGRNAYQCVYNDCHYVGSLPTDVSLGVYQMMGDADGTVRCSGCGCFVDKKLNKLYENKQKWRDYMLENGAPYDGKLRGIIVRSNKGFSYGPKNWVDMPAGLEKYVCDNDFEGDDFYRGMSVLFPDEYQEELKRLRKRLLNNEFEQTLAVPLIDSAGNKYGLFLRPSIPLEDEHGLIDPPERCEQWDIVESTMEYPY
jgi:hypothetical protein